MGDIFQVKARFAGRILIPDKALPRCAKEGEKLVSSDNVCCMAHFLSTWDNSDGRYDDELEGLCQRQWGLSFAAIRSVWIGRIDNIGTVWHYIELIRDDG